MAAAERPDAEVGAGGGRAELSRGRGAAGGRSEVRGGRRARDEAALGAVELASPEMEGEGWGLKQPGVSGGGGAVAGSLWGARRPLG